MKRKRANILVTSFLMVAAQSYSTICVAQTPDHTKQPVSSREAAAPDTSLDSTELADQTKVAGNLKPESSSASLGVPLLKNLVADQKAIWTSPFHLRWADGSWLFPLAAVTGGFLATDRAVPPALSTDPKKLNRYTSFSNYGVYSLIGAGGGLCSLLLASNSTITANAVIVGFARAAGFVETLVLGSGSNVLNVNSNSLGSLPALSGREGGRMFFAGPTGSLKIRAQDGTSRATLFVAATRSSNPGRSLALGLGMSSEQYADLTGHDSDLLLSTLVIGDERHGNFTLPPEFWTNSFSFSQRASISLV